MNAPNLEYELFPAALATRNTLAGRPEIGIKDIDWLVEHAMNEEAFGSDAGLRCKAHPANESNPIGKTLDFRVEVWERRIETRSNAIAGNRR